MRCFVIKVITDYDFTTELKLSLQLCDSYQRKSQNLNNLSVFQATDATKAFNHVYTTPVTLTNPSTVLSCFLIKTELNRVSFCNSPSVELFSDCILVSTCGSRLFISSITSRKIIAWKVKVGMAVLKSKQTRVVGIISTYMVHPYACFLRNDISQIPA